MNVEQMIEILHSDYRMKTVTWYRSPTSTVRISKKHKHKKNAYNPSYIVTVGKPNYASKLKVKTYIKAGEPFPVKKLEFKYYPRAKYE